MFRKTDKQTSRRLSICDVIEINKLNQSASFRKQSEELKILNIKKTSFACEFTAIHSDDADVFGRPRFSSGIYSIKQASNKLLNFRLHII